VRVRFGADAEDDGCIESDDCNVREPSSRVRHVDGLGVSTYKGW